MDYIQPAKLLSMGFLRQEMGDLPNPGTEQVSLMSPALEGAFFITYATWGALSYISPI